MYGLTDTGRMREQNEDSIGLVPEAGLVVVADGMGGHQAGEVASKLAVDVITKYVADSFTDTAKAPTAALEIKSMGEAVQEANRAIYELSRQRPECAGMGSTVVAVVFYKDQMCVSHVGDSRLYRFRFGILEQITQDHSVIQELINRGLATEEEARESVSKNLVTRALGIDPAVSPDISEHAVMDEDIYLLCSDGLNDVLADGDIEMILTEHGRNLEAAVQTMIETANLRGGPDNISVVLVRTGAHFSRQKEALLKRNQADEEI